jgi:hypothetical protein
LPDVIPVQVEGLELLALELDSVVVKSLEFTLEPFTGDELDPVKFGIRWGNRALPRESFAGGYVI